MKMKKYEDALKLALMAIKEYPNYFNAYYNLSIISLKLNRKKDAINYFRRCVTLDKNSFKYAADDDELKEILEFDEIKRLKSSLAR